MSKEIVSGCRAIVVNDDIPPCANGVMVTVLHKDLTSPQDCPFWVVAEPMKKYHWDDNSIPEYKLQRIDDDDVELSRWSKVEEVCGWNPNKVTA